MIQLNGDGISSDQAQEIASLFSDVSGAFGVDVVEVTVMDNEDVDSGQLADIVIIGISIGATVIGLLLIVLLLVSLVCIMRQFTKGRRRAKYRQVCLRPSNNNTIGNADEYVSCFLQQSVCSYPVSL